MKLTIDPEFKMLIPPLSDDEYEQLEANLKSEGCRDPLVTWNGIIIDGHNRFEICTANGISFEKISKRFADRAEVIEWIIRNQFGRRNLDAYQRTKLALRLEEAIAARAKANMTMGINQHSPKQKSAEAIPHIETREEIAKLAGVSRDTVDKVKAIEKKAAPEVRQALAKGEISINKAHQTVKAPKIEPVADDKPKKRIPNYIACEGMLMWGMARSQLERIDKKDTERVKALNACIAYCQERISKNK